MKDALTILTILLLSLLTSCLREDYKSDNVFSPSGKYYFISTVNSTDKSRDDYSYVIVSLFNSDGQIISKLNTRAGDFNKWAIGWDIDKDTIIMNSSDIGIFAWRIENKELKKVELNENLKMQAKKIKLVKYNE